MVCESLGYLVDRVVRTRSHRRPDRCSRQEEAQRLGRVMRPKASGGEAFFYTIVARDTVDQMFALNRQRFLAEQGYDYDIIDAWELG